MSGGQLAASQACVSVRNFSRSAIRGFLLVPPAPERVAAGQVIVLPPSMTMACPVMKVPAFEAN
ncbi:MAG TPA: hypothetical protein VIH15_03500, partial [Casimicrobiaceae bacterium]